MDQHSLKVLVGFLTGIVLLSFVNMSTLDLETVSGLVQDSKLTSEFMKEKQRPVLIEEALIKRKLEITNYISMLTKPKNCSQLLEQDPYMLSGPYLFFPDDSLEPVSLIRCEVANGIVVSEQLVRTIKPQVCDRTDHDCLMHFPQKNTVYCGSGDHQNSFNTCYINRLLEEPRLEQDLSGKCVAGETFGKNETGIWVKDGCKAMFKVLFLPDPATYNAATKNPFFESNLFDEPVCQNTHSSGNYVQGYLREIVRDPSDPLKIGFADCKSSSRYKRAVQLKSSIDNRFLEMTNLEKQRGYSQHPNEKLLDVMTSGQALTQELIYTNRMRDCDDVLEANADKFTGRYYFFTQEFIPSERRLDNLPRTCNFNYMIPRHLEGMVLERLSENNSVWNAIDTNFTGFVQRKPGSELYESTMARWSSRKAPRVLKNGGYALVPTKCISKKDARVKTEYEQITGVDANLLKTSLVLYGGQYYCFEDGEEFYANAENLVHGYQYEVLSNSNWSRNPSSYGPFESWTHAVDQSGTRVDVISTVVPTKSQLDLIDSRVSEYITRPKATCEILGERVLHGECIMTFVNWRS